MYRKYSSSAKCSRNERLAQLSEQESVIERKKKEILAKIEAKKKKETEEALRKLESTNTHINDSPISKNNSCHRKKDGEIEEIKPQTPRNAFSNDGSFLDQFKKLSRSGLGSTGISLSVKGTQKEEEESSKGKQGYAGQEENKKLIENNQSRWNSDDRGRGRKSYGDDFCSRNSQNCNIQSQPAKPGMDHPFPEQILAGASKLKPGENINKVNSPFSISASGSLIKHTDIKKKLQNQEPDDSFDHGDQMVESKRSKNMRKTFWDFNETQSQSQCLNSTSSSDKNSLFGPDDSTRISPAFTHEADNSVASETYHSRKTVRYGEETPDFSATAFAKEAKKLLPEGNNDCATTLNYSNPDKLQDVAFLPNTSENTDIKNDNTERKDSSDSEGYPKDPFPLNENTSYNNSHFFMDKNGDGYQADCEDGSSFTTDQRQKKVLFRKAATENLPISKEVPDESKDGENVDAGDVLNSGETRKRRKKSRWGDEVVPAVAQNAGTNSGSQRPLLIPPVTSGVSTGKTPMLTKLTRSDPGLIQYAKQTFGSTNLSEEDWKKAEDHYKINLLYQDMVKKRAEIERLEKAGKFKYEYDSDEDVEGGTWEHKLRQQEMLATQLWAEELTRQAAGKHHIGDFLPPEELERFMERYNAVKQGRKPDLSDYKEFKLKEDNVGYRLLQKMGWNEGQGLGQDGSGITNPVNKAPTRSENQGLGLERPDGLEAGDDEYDAYRKRMMLAYRFRPNPLNNPRRPYY